MEAVAAVTATVLPLWQSRLQHEEALKVSNELHRQAIESNQTLHKEEIQQSEHLFAKDCALERELHYGQMSHDLDIARREGVRDAWSQRSQLLQTLMIVDAIVFAAAYSILIQGAPPQIISHWILRCYSVALGLSMSLLFVSVWCSLKLQSRLSYYDMHRQDVVYVCGKQHRYFGEYYACHCKSMSNAAVTTFYLGTTCTLTSAAIYSFTKIYYDYSNAAAAVIFASILGVGGVIPYMGIFIDKWEHRSSAFTDDAHHLDSDGDMHEPTALEPTAASMEDDTTSEGTSDQ